MGILLGLSGAVVIGLLGMGVVTRVIVMVAMLAVVTGEGGCQFGGSDRND